MNTDFGRVLWLLKLGAPLNLYFAASLLWHASPRADARVLAPALILLLVSAYRCLWPVRYEHEIVLHDTPLSSIFITRLLATFSEIAYIYLFSQLLRVLNVEALGWVEVVSWLMVLQVCISQVCVWIAVLRRRHLFYFYEEFGWLLIFAANAAASLALLHSAFGGGEALLWLNLAFAALYLPWQCLHLRMLWRNAQIGGAAPAETLARGLQRALHGRNRRTDAASWGGWVGLSWMVGYWATLIPAWVWFIATRLPGAAAG